MVLVETARQRAALARIRDIAGPKGWLDTPADMAPYLADWRGLYRGEAAAVVRPAATAETAEIVRLAAGAGIGIVPQGGNTGMMGGATPHEHGREIVLSTERLDRIRDVDPLDNSMTVEAGVVLRTAQDAAAAADRLFPLSLGAEGSCRIGGNLSTNAGGTAVLRYGNARDLVLGLEVVLPDGRVWDGLRRLRKDNTGYDLKQLFIGAEGTLGIITAAVLKLFPRPRAVETAFVGVGDPAAAVDLLTRARNLGGDAVTACELIPRFGLDLVLAHLPGAVDPLAGRHAWYVLLECSAPVADGQLRERMETTLAEALEAGAADDAVLAASEGQRRQLWALREGLTEAQRLEGGTIRHDVSVAVSRVPRLIEAATRAVEAELPGIRPLAFGHVGDGNVHFNVLQPPGMAPEAFLAHSEAITRRVHDIVADLEGSISAEHGIGRLKRDELAARKSPVELDLMRRIKNALDPTGIMNPGKVL